MSRQINQDQPAQLAHNFWLCFCSAWFTTRAQLEHHLASCHTDHPGEIQLLEVLN